MSNEAGTEGPTEEGSVVIAEQKNVKDKPELKIKGWLRVLDVTVVTTTLSLETEECKDQQKTWGTSRNTWGTTSEIKEWKQQKHCHQKNADIYQCQCQKVTFDLSNDDPLLVIQGFS